MLQNLLKPADEPGPLPHAPAVERLAAREKNQPSVALPRLPGLLRSMMSTGGVRLASAAGTVGLTVVLARVMSVNDFGRFSLCFTSLLVLSMLSRLGAENALLRFAGSAWHRGDRSLFLAYCRLSLSLVLRNSVLLTLVGWPLLSLVGTAYWDGSSAMASMLLALVPWSLVFTISFIFKAAGQPQAGSLFETGTISICGAAVVGAISFAGHPITTSGVAVVLTGCATVLAVIGSAVLHRQGLWPRSQNAPGLDRKLFLTYSINLMSITMMQLFANWGGTFLLEFAWTQRDVAMFASAARLAMVSVLLISVASLVVGPRLSGAYDSGDRTRFRKLVSSASLIALAVNVPMLLVLVLGSRQIMGILGETYADSAGLLSVIASGHLAGLVFGFAPIILAMSGKDRALRSTTLCSSTICILVTLVLALPYGAWGASVGAALYPVIQNWGAAAVVRRTLGFWPIAGCHRSGGAVPVVA